MNANESRLAGARAATRTLELRLNKEVSSAKNRTLHLDGYNIIMLVEAALGGGVILRGRDGALRDLASEHGNFRRVEETAPALELIASTLDELRVKDCVWWLDAPVSNSGRLRALILETAAKAGREWRAELVPCADAALKKLDDSVLVATADSAILDVVAALVQPWWRARCGPCSRRVDRRFGRTVTKPSIVGLIPTMLGLRPMIFGLRPALFGLRPTVFGLRPTVFGLRPTMLGLRPTMLGLRSEHRLYSPTLSIMSATASGSRGSKSAMSSNNSHSSTASTTPPGLSVVSGPRVSSSKMELSV